MRKITILFIGTLLQVVAVGQVANSNDQLSVLNVSGQAEVSVIPDRAVLRFGVAEIAQTAALAQQSVNRVMNAMLQELRGLGIAEEKIQTSRIQLYPIQEPAGKERIPRISGYRAENSLAVILEDVGRIGDVLDAATKMGGNEIQGINFELQDDTLARAEALRLAVADARRKADVMAAALGVQLLRVLEVGESSGRAVPAAYRMARVQMEAFESTPVSAGQITVSASVNIRYQISG